MPKFNEQITSGFHQRDFDNVEQTYERGLQTVFKEIEERGVWFFGLKSVKPTEMFEHISSKTQNKAFETNKESLYPVGLQIGFGPTKETAMMFPTTYVFLPYADEYGDVWIRGTQYSLLMVLADRGFSVTKDDQIFVRVPGYKFKVGTEVFEYVQVHHETANLFESKIPINLSANRFYKCSEARKPNPNKTPLPLLAWYLFAENGVAETFKRFAECEYAIGDRDAIVQAYPASKGWSIFTTQGRQLVKCVGRYDDCGYAIAVRPIDSKRKGVISTAAHQYVASLLFMFDCFSGYVDLD
ncbi:MAG: hypothetical protein EOM76_12355, partial [Sphingobacteriia bacterium]|nr:hypothetical protein [Sphingobacteriia bacterium]